jgi:cation transporter-like permease
MLRVFLATSAVLLLGLPAVVAACALLMRTAGSRSEAELFPVAIGSSLAWTVLLFAVLWFLAPERER